MSEDIKTYQIVGFPKTVLSVNGVTPDDSGNVEVEGGSGGGSPAIIDVVELPTENINENVFYRLLTARFVSNSYLNAGVWTCYRVASLPAVGEPVSTDMVNITAYYNLADGGVYGYADSAIASQAGIPAGWYPIDVLGQAFDVKWGGVIDDISVMDDESAYVLLSNDYYVYQNGWVKHVFAYERPPEFDIRWDGVIGDRFALDVSSLGYENTYFVKISDDVLSETQVIGSTYYQSRGFTWLLSESDIDASTFPGAISLDNGIVIVHNSDDLNSAFGLPAGYVTNGIYFVYIVDEFFTNRLVAPAKITKISSEYVDIAIEDVEEALYKLDIPTDTIRYNVTQSLTSTQKQIARSNIDVYSKSEVDTKIANAITGAIGGSY